MEPCLLTTSTILAKTVKAGSHTGVRKALSCLLWLAIWQIASMKVGSELLVASPLATFTRLLQLVVEPRFWEVVGFSASRIIGGFLLAFLVAIVAGACAQRWRVVSDVLALPVALLRSAPVVCIVVILLMWFGSRSVSVVSVFLMAFPAVYYSVREALTAVDKKVAEMLSVFDVGGLRRALAQTWPEMLPFLIATSHSVCGMSWKAGVAAELIGTPLGSIGERIYQAKLLLETGDVFSWTIAIVSFAALFERLFVKLLKLSGKLTLALAVQGCGRGTSLQVCRGAGIKLADASIGYPGKVVQQHLSICLPATSRCCLVDPSGAGKTTFFRTVLGLQPLLAGNIGSCTDDRNMRMAAVFQEARLIEAMDAYDNVVLAAGPACDGSHAEVLLRGLLPAEALTVPVKQLSGGQRRRVELVRALAAPCDLIVLDEPFAALDDTTRHNACNVLSRELRGRTLLMSSHSKKDARLLHASCMTLAAMQHRG